MPKHTCDWDIHLIISSHSISQIIDYKRFIFMWKKWTRNRQQTSICVWEREKRDRDNETPSKRCIYFVFKLKNKASVWTEAIVGTVVIYATFTVCLTDWLIGHFKANRFICGRTLILAMCVMCLFLYFVLLFDCYFWAHLWLCVGVLLFDHVKARTQFDRICYYFY